MSDRPLTIHFFTSYVHEQGTYFRYHNLARGLVNAGHAVTVYGCDWNEKSPARREDRDGIHYDIVPESWKTSVFSQACHPLTTLRRALRRYPRCDVAHVFQPFLGSTAAWWRSPARTHFYDWDDQWTDGLYSGPITSWRQRWPRYAIRTMETHLPHWADHVTTISHYLADRATRFGARSVTVINSGSWPDPMPSRAEARAALGLGMDQLYAGFMGHAVSEMGWCYDALEAHRERLPRLRLALCGAPPPGLEALSPPLRDRIDYLGVIPSSRARMFAAALDLALLPMQDNTFNRSRLPQKYGDHLITGVPLLCSDVGECGRLNPEFATVFRAGTTRDEWVRAFGVAINKLADGNPPAADHEWLSARLSWAGMSRRLEDAYRGALAGSAHGRGI